MSLDGYQILEMLQAVFLQKTEGLDPRKLIRSEDSQVRLLALRVLIAYNSKQDLPLLIEASKDINKEVAEEAIVSLGEYHSEKSYRCLMDIAISGKNSIERRRLAWKTITRIHGMATVWIPALQFINDEKMIKMSLDRMERENLFRDPAVFKVLLQKPQSLIIRLLAEVKKEIQNEEKTNTEMNEFLATQPGAPEPRIEMQVGIEESAAETGGDTLSPQQIYDDFCSFRHGVLGDRDPVQFWFKLLIAEDPADRDLGFYCLSQLGDEKILPVLAMSIADPDMLVRQEGVRMIKKFFDQGVG